MEEQARRLGKEYAAIFQAHALFLTDPTFLGPIEKKIRQERVNAEWAVEVVSEALAARLRDLPDMDLALRASDLDDVATILKRSLGEGGDAAGLWGAPIARRASGPIALRSLATRSTSTGSDAPPTLIFTALNPWRT